MKKEHLVAFVGFLATWVSPTVKLVERIIGWAGLPGDLKTWQSFAQATLGAFSVVDWLLLALGFVCLLYAGGWRIGGKRGSEKEAAPLSMAVMTRSTDTPTRIQDTQERVSELESNHAVMEQDKARLQDLLDQGEAQWANAVALGQRVPPPEALLHSWYAAFDHLESPFHDALGAVGAKNAREIQADLIRQRVDEHDSEENMPIEGFRLAYRQAFHKRQRALDEVGKKIAAMEREQAEIREKLRMYRA